MSESPTIKKAKQYTVVGIKTGKFDEDLERLFKVIQRRRAALGQIKVLSINPNSIPSQEAETVSDTTETEGGYVPIYRWPYNQDALQGPAVRVYDDAMSNARDDTYRTQPPLSKLSGQVNGSVNVDGAYYFKHQLIGRIVAFKDSYAEESGIAAAYVETIARRNLTCAPLMTSALATNRKVSAVKSKARAGKLVVVPPEAIADFYIDNAYDPIVKLVDAGTAGV